MTMAKFDFKCPQCGESIEADDSLCGQVAECPSCGKGIVVPRNVANISKASVRLRPVSREETSMLSSTPVPKAVRRLSESERMARAEAKRNRLAKLVEFTKSIGLLLVVVVVGWVGWGVFKEKMPIGQTEGNDTEGSVAERRWGNESDAATTETGSKMGSSSVKKADLETCKEKVVVIGNEGKGGGTAFLAKMEGKTYLLTNEHVARATDEFKRVYLLDGTRLELGTFEVAEERDIVRFEVQDGLPAFELSKEMPNVGEKIAIYGNSAGKGAITEERGDIKAVGTFRLEVAASVVAGNSGSPVVNDRGEVVGIYTYVTFGEASKDFDMLDSRYKEGRKWAIRFTGVKWIKSDWSEYCRQVALLEDAKEFCARLLPFLAAQANVKGKRFTYDLRYDEMSKIRFRQDSDLYRMRLLDLSRTHRVWLAASSEFQRSLDGSSEKDQNEKRASWRDSVKGFSVSIQNALHAISDTFKDVIWITSRMKDEFSFFKEWGDEQIVEQKRVLTDIGEKINEIEKSIEAEQKGTLFDRTKNFMAIVKAGNSMGSGFLVKMDGKIRFITNEHVARGGNPFSATLPDGTALRFEPIIEVASNRDLVRMTVVGADAALELAQETPKEGTKIHVFGNSDGGGVLTSLHGSIRGVGPDRLETQITTVQGNSGSAILNDNGEVLGVVTYATFLKEPENWLKNGTSFNDVRRFGYRLNNVKWEKIAWQDYAIRAMALAECERYVDLCRRVCFRERRLLHKYEVQEWIEAGKLKQRPLRDALLAVAHADEAYKAFYSEWDKLNSLRGQVKEHSLNDPSSKIIRLYKRFPSVKKACSTARLNALKEGLNFIDGRDWKISRLKLIDESHGEVDADLFRWFFSVHIRRFKDFYKDELIGIRVPELPASLKKRL